MGEAYNWVDRLSWSETEIRAYLDDPNVSLWVMTVDGALAGYFELRTEPDRSVEIVISACCRSSPAGDMAGFS